MRSPGELLFMTANTVTRPDVDIELVSSPNPREVAGKSVCALQAVDIVVRFAQFCVGEQGVNLFVTGATQLDSWTLVAAFRAKVVALDYLWVWNPLVRDAPSTERACGRHESCSNRWIA
jgi:hypothetical protein